MSSYSKQASNSFQKHTSYQKPQQSQLKSKERSIGSGESNKDLVNEHILQPSSNHIQKDDNDSLPGRYPVKSSDKISLSAVNQQENAKKGAALTALATSATTTQVSSTNIASNATLRPKPLKSSNILGGAPSNKYHQSNPNNNNIKWKRNNFPMFYGGYPSPGRVNVPSNIPFYGRGYPTDTNLYFPSGICPPHYSPAHHPHIRQHHLAHQRFLALSSVAQSHPYQKYLTLNHISNLKRSRSAHGSFRSKTCSNISNNQQVANR